MKMKFKVGEHFYLDKGLPKDGIYKCHILAVVDKHYIVYKWWGKHKQWWHYEVESSKLLEIQIGRSNET
jgi:hypothetical protein